MTDGSSHPPVVCPRGYHCNPTSLTSVACPAGTSDYREGISTDVACPSCSKGYFNPLTKQSFCPFPCPSGFYGLIEGGTNETACAPCPTGHYCDETQKFEKHLVVLHYCLVFGPTLHRSFSLNQCGHFGRPEQTPHDCWRLGPAPPRPADTQTPALDRRTPRSESNDCHRTECSAMYLFTLIQAYFTIIK